MKVRAASHSSVLLLVVLIGWSEAFQTATRSSVRVVPSTSRTTRNHRLSFLVPSPPVPPTQVYSTTEEEAVDTIITTASSSSKDPISFKSRSANKIGAQPIVYSDLTIGVLKESFPGENRVSQTPDAVATLVKAGFNVIVQSGGMFLLNGLSTCRIFQDIAYHFHGSAESSAWILEFRSALVLYIQLDKSITHTLFVLSNFLIYLNLTELKHSRRKGSLQ